MEKIRHHCAACGRKRYNTFMYRFYLHPIGVTYWLCNTCTGNFVITTVDQPKAPVNRIRIEQVPVRPYVHSSGQNLHSPTVKNLTNV